MHLVVFPRYIPKNQRMANPHSDLFHGTEEPRDLFVNAIRVISSVVMWAPCFGPRLLINESPPMQAPVGHPASSQTAFLSNTVLTPFLLYG